MLYQCTMGKNSFETSNYSHALESEWVSEWVSGASERMSKWPSTYVQILGCPEPLCIGRRVPSMKAWRNKTPSRKKDEVPNYLRKRTINNPRSKNNKEEKNRAQVSKRKKPRNTGTRRPLHAQKKTIIENKNKKEIKPKETEEVNWNKRGFSYYFNEWKRLSLLFLFKERGCGNDDDDD